MDKKPTILYLFFSIVTGMVGYYVNKSYFWAILNFVFPIFSWLKWLIFHQVTLNIIKDTFAWFFN